MMFGVSPRPFSTYRRRDKRGRRVYSVKFANGARRVLLNPDGTRCTNKADADAAAARLADAERRVIVITVTHARHEELSAAAAEVQSTIADYLIGLHDARRSAESGEPLAAMLSAFWAPGSDYIRRKEAAGAPLSAMYVNTSRGAVRKYILPWLAEKYPTLTVRGVRPLHMEALKQYLVDRGLSASRVNGVLKAIRTPLANLWRMEVIPDNPGRKVPKLPEPHAARELLTIDEARRFFGRETSPRYATANLTAALAGLRMGEIRGMLAEDIREIRHGRTVTYELHVCHNWQSAEDFGRQLKAPKHSTAARPKYRRVPIVPRLAKALLALAARNPHGDGFVFWGDVARVPLSNTAIEQRYHETLAAIGIPAEERKRRGLTFHSWRHWYRSMLDAGGLSSRAGDELTGHAEGSGIGKRYTHVTAEQAEAARVISRQIEGRVVGRPRRSGK